MQGPGSIWRTRMAAGGKDVLAVRGGWGGRDVLAAVPVFGRGGFPGSVAGRPGPGRPAFMPTGRLTHGIAPGHHAFPPVAPNTGAGVNTP